MKQLKLAHQGIGELEVTSIVKIADNSLVDGFIDAYKIGFKSDKDVSMITNESVKAGEIMWLFIAKETDDKDPNYIEYEFDAAKNENPTERSQHINGTDSGFSHGDAYKSIISKL